VTLDTAFLGLIALATTIMAVIQVAVTIAAARAAREAAAAVRELRTELGPIIASARKATDDAARITALALTQVERVDAFVQTTTQRVDETLGVVQDVIAGPFRQGTALVAGLKAVLEYFASRRGGDRRRPQGDEDEDESLFIG
jgi:hypothetical protein